MIRVRAFVVEKRWIVATVVRNNINVPIVIKISGGQSSSNNRSHKVRAKRVGGSFKLALAAIVPHKHRFLVRDLCVVEMNVVEHRSVYLHNVIPSVIVVVQELHGNA